mmetsp:Transcript_33174/g.54438  ORF Transcript_33174/g.54438 Transcript_33174/m.54438 type:complete len:101 (+) Transcript_33174:3676-3978(+)
MLVLTPLLMSPTHCCTWAGLLCSPPRMPLSPTNTPGGAAEWLRHPPPPLGQSTIAGWAGMTYLAMEYLHKRKAIKALHRSHTSLPLRYMTPPPPPGGPSC